MNEPLPHYDDPELQRFFETWMKIGELCFIPVTKEEIEKAKEAVERFRREKGMI